MPVISRIYCPKDYDEGKKAAIKYRKAGKILVSLEQAVNKDEARRIKDYLLWMTYALKGFAFQHKKVLLFSFLKGPALKDLRELGGWAW